MKHFKLVGPKTTRDFDINDDEMLTWDVIKIADFQKDPKLFARMTLPMQNEVITETR